MGPSRWGDERAAQIEAMVLEEIGRRFHERLDSMGLRRDRIEVTSALRTAADQAKLRGVTVNAARGTSTHEFGTTLDPAHREFAAPSDAALRVPSDPQLERRAACLPDVPYVSRERALQDRRREPVGSGR